MQSRFSVCKNVTAAFAQATHALQDPAIGAHHQLTRHSGGHGAKEHLALIRFRTAKPDTALTVSNKPSLRSKTSASSCPTGRFLFHKNRQSVRRGVADKFEASVRLMGHSKWSKDNPPWNAQKLLLMSSRAAAILLFSLDSVRIVGHSDKGGHRRTSTRKSASIRPTSEWRV